ncbi:hypothetical protein ACFY12_32420 [Streptomyces sp. NPDC001339]|uniref:hypothetical protein n=1 Tax=Streptomyces sp. NPDC001339 TaxID=3364563 RepID=UPI00367D140C
MAWCGPAARGRSGRLPEREQAGPRPRIAPGRRISAAVIGGLWWWAALRLAVWPQSAGVIEGTVVLGGWGLSLLPVHCVPWTGSGEGTWRRAAAREVRAVLTRARRRRTGGE